MPDKTIRAPTSAPPPPIFNVVLSKPDQPVTPEITTEAQPVRVWD
ncbi:MAG: hypothetical protein P8Y45_23140 [Exilibacterium sp.]